MASPVSKLHSSVIKDKTESLAAFPEEVLQRVFAPLERKDLKVLRGVCNTFRRVASERLFESIEVRDDEDGASKIQLEHIIAGKYLSGHHNGFFSTLGGQL